MTAAPILRTEGLTRRFGGLLAVGGVDFELPTGEVRALIGPNGAGKSTFIGLVSGRIPPSAGRVWFEGADVTALPAHRRIARGIAYTFQITSVFAGLSLWENVALAARRALGADRRAVAERVAESLDRVGLPEPVGTLAGDLSYGHQRLLEIAMGLAQAPRLLILDEPTQGLAEAEIANFKRLVRDLAGGTTILLVEHNMPVVMELSDRVTVLNFGEILAEDAPDAIRADKAVQAAYLGTG